MTESSRVQPTFDAPLMQYPPTAAPRPQSAVPAPSSAPAPQRIFAADRPGGEETGPASAQLERVAELLAHRGTEGPLTVAIVGGAGSGKSRALAQVVTQAAALARGGGDTASPYVGRLTIVRLDAGDLGADPRAALAARVHAVLARTTPEIATAAADEATHSGTDPHARLRSLTESLDVARKRLDGERRARGEAESRRARLVETILYESGGSRVDAYARSNRTAIESALAAFGFTKDDSVATYKGLVQTLTETGGPAARVFASMKSLWAYRGQTKLLVWALLFLLSAWGLGSLGRDMSWLDGAQSAGETARSMADKLRTHGNWFALARSACLVGAALCVLACLLRAVRFSRPLLRGAALVDADLDVRRGELDHLVAHHTQRVDVLAAEADTLARRASEAERRAGDAEAPTPALLAPDEAAAADRTRRAYLRLVDARLSQDAKGAGRLLVALDELDRLAPVHALAALEGAADALRHQSFGLIAAFDPTRLIRAGGEDARERLTRLVQVPVRIDGEGEAAWVQMVARVAAPRPPAAPASADPTRSSLDKPLEASERTLLAHIAPLAGPAPRGVKRLVNLYRLGRSDAGEALPAFAFALALAIGGTPDEKAAFDTIQSGRASTGPLGQAGTPRLQAALDRLNALRGRPMSVDEARRATQLAARWSLEG